MKKVKKIENYYAPCVVVDYCFDGEDEEIRSIETNFYFQRTVEYTVVWEELVLPHIVEDNYRSIVDLTKPAHYLRNE